MKKLLFLAFWALPSQASAAELFCRADFDESSHYEVTALVGAGGLEGSVALRFRSDDGMDLHADLRPESQAIIPGQAVRFNAQGEAMGASLDVAFANGEYRGVLGVSFGLDHAEPLALDTVCTLRY